MPICGGNKCLIEGTVGEKFKFERKLFLWLDDGVFCCGIQIARLGKQAWNIEVRTSKAREAVGVEGTEESKQEN